MPQRQSHTTAAHTMPTLAACVVLFLLGVHAINARVITADDSEWGSLCTLNTSEFIPENVDNSNRLLSLFPGLRNLDSPKRISAKPCCFPPSWESEFTVHIRRIGNRPRREHAIFRIFRNATGNPETVLSIGSRVKSSRLCETGQGSPTRIPVCPQKTGECLQVPYLGEPRCISLESGFYYIPKPTLSNREMWFTDSRIPTGGMKRHVYSFSRMYGICKLESYQTLTGQYVDSKNSCRVMFLKDQMFLPIPGTFRLTIEPNTTEDMFYC